MVAISEVTNQLSIEVVQTVQINAPLEVTFEELLEQMGPSNETPDGNPLPMKIEPWPGGRWFRDLGGQNGHFWGQIQAIKRPELFEIYGPMFMSYAAISNVQFRLAAADNGTRMTLRHSAFGLLEEEHRLGVSAGWDALLARLKNKF